MNGFSCLSPDWQRCISDFLADNPSSTSRQRFRSTLNCFVCELSKPLDQVSESDIEAFAVTSSRHRNHGNPSTHNTQRRRFHIVHSFYAFASTYLVNGKPLYQNPLPVSPVQPDKPQEALFVHVSEVWRQAIEQFLHVCYERSGSWQSLKSYRNTLKMFFTAFPKDPIDITKADCTAFLQMLSQGRRNFGNPLSIGSKNNRLMCLNSLFRYLSEQDVTLPDGSIEPLYNKPLPTRGLHYGKQARPYRSMDQREVTVFFAAIDQSSVKGKRDFCIMLFAFLTCRRREELARLKWEDISEVIFIEDGQERQGYAMRYVGKGHAREVRVQEAPASCMRALLDYLRAANRLDGIKPGDYLFMNCRNQNDYLRSDRLNGLFHDIARRANLPVERLSFHSLRHAGARARSECGSTIQEIQRVLDHASPEITFRYLSYLAPASDTGARKLEARLSFLTR